MNVPDVLHGVPSWHSRALRWLAAAGWRWSGGGAGGSKTRCFSLKVPSWPGV